jgi:putative transposase
MRKINFSSNEFYHVYNRGTEKCNIFLDRADHYRFIILLYIANGDKSINMRTVRTFGTDYFGLSRFEQGQSLVDIGAYCLMPNHFHILLREHTEGGISQLMLKVMTAYTMYFNGKYQRTGTLWEGPFKATHADSDEYLKYLFSYIHLNPIKLIQSDWKEKGIKNIEKAKKYLKNYEYSSCLDYFDLNRHQSVILNKKDFPEYFINNLDFEENLFDWLKFDPNKLDIFSFAKAKPL